MWPVNINELQRVQVELSSFCNAACPSCDRTVHHRKGYIHSAYYKSVLNDKYISLEQFKQFVDPYQFLQLTQFHFCGNIDESILNPDVLDICKYVDNKFKNRSKYSTWISTNGGAKDEKFWKALAEIPTVHVTFGIDGLEDTNSIYRKNVKWKKLQNNFRTYIKHGGEATWQFIVFDHNEHQITEAKQRADDEGFWAFKTIWSGRPNPNNNEVKNTQSSIVNYEKKSKPDNKIVCKATLASSELSKSVYVDVNRNVWPCCWMGTENNKIEFEKKITSKFGYYLSNGLQYNTLEEILIGDMFGHFYNNINKDSLTICNIMCKYNDTDTKKHEHIKPQLI